MIRRAGLWVLALLVFGCVSTEMELPPSHPANASARTAPVPEVGRTLVGNFDALAPESGDTASSPNPSVAQDPHAGHAHADPHAGHPNPAPAQPPEAASAGPASAAQYTCPMHPEIVRSEPGNCPICGMKLVPAKPKGQAKP